MSDAAKDALFWPLVAWFFVTLSSGVGAGLYFWSRKRARSIEAKTNQAFGADFGGGWASTPGAGGAGAAGGGAGINGSWGMWVDENAKMPGDEAIRMGKSAQNNSGSGESFQAAPDRGLESWQINAKELKMGPRIGVGNVGEVYKALFKGRPVAVKKLLANWLADQDMLERFREEAYLMSTMSHPNVLAFRGAVLDKDTGHISIVTDFCERGSLTEVLRSRQPLSWQRRLQMARDVALGMSYIHVRAGIIQRDLKSSNLLVQRDYTVVISDFGLSRMNAPGKMQTYCGTPAYLAPEIVRQEPYSQAADVYSYSIILWEILTREEPYPGGTGLALAYAVATQGLRPPIPAYCPVEWAALMTKCWADEPEKRPSFDEIQRALAGMIRIFDDHLKQRAAGSGSGSGSLPASNNGSSGHLHKSLTSLHLEEAAAAFASSDGKSSLPSLADIVLSVTASSGNIPGDGVSGAAAVPIVAAGATGSLSSAAGTNLVTAPATATAQTAATVTTTMTLE